MPTFRWGSTRWVSSPDTAARRFTRPDDRFSRYTPLSQTPMWETCSVQLKVSLPRELAAQAEEVQKSDPEFLSRVVLYGLTRRSIYHQLKDQPSGAPDLIAEDARLPL